MTGPDHESPAEAAGSLAAVVAALADSPDVELGDLATLRSDLVGPSRPAARWVIELVARADGASLRRLYEDTGDLHEAFEELRGATTSRAVAARLRSASGLDEAFGDGQPATLHALRVLAGLGLALVSERPPQGPLAAALVWFEEACSSPITGAVPWSPADLAAGDGRLLRTLEALHEAATGSAASAPAVYTTAVTLTWLARGRAGRLARETVAVGVLFDRGTTGESGRLKATYLPGLPSALVPHPDRAVLFTADEDFGASMDLAWRLAGGDRIDGTVLWCVEDTDDPVLRIEDASLGAAFAVVLDEVRRVQRPLPSWTGAPAWLGHWLLWLFLLLRRLRSTNAVTGRLDDQGVLQSVAGYERKLRAPGKRHRVIVPSYDREAAALADRGLEAGHPRADIVPVLTWSAAARKARRYKPRVWLRLVAALSVGGLVIGLWLTALADADARRARIDGQVQTLLKQSADQRPDDPALALRLALAADRISPSDKTRNTIAEGLLTTRYRGELPKTAKVPIALAYTSGGKVLAALDDAQVTLWDLAGRRAVGHIPARTATPTAFAASVDGSLLAVGQAGGSEVELWDVRRPEAPVRVAKAPVKKEPRAVRLSGDGRRMAVLSGEEFEDPGEVTVWDVTDRARPTRLTTVPVTNGEAVALNTKGDRLAVAGVAVEVLNLSAPDHPVNITRISTGGVNPLTDVAFAAQHDDFVYTATTRPLAAGIGAGNKFVEGWDISSPPQGEPKDAFEGQGLIHVAPTGLVATIGDDGSVIVGDQRLRPDGAKAGSRAPVTGEAAAPTAVAMGPDGRTVATVGAGAVVRFWDTSDMIGFQEMSSATRSESEAYDPRHGVLATVEGSGPGTSTKTIVLTDAAEGASYGTLARWPTSAGSIWSMAFGPDGRTLMFDRGDGTVGRLDVSQPRAPKALADLPATMAPVNGGALSADGKVLATSSGTELRLWDSSGDVPVRTLALDAFGSGPSAKPTGSGASPDPSTIEPMDDDPGSLGPDDVREDGAGDDELTLNSGPAPMGGVATPTPTARQGSASPGPNPVDEDSGSLRIAFAPKGRILAVARASGEIALWDVSDPRAPRRTALIAAGDPAARAGRLLFSGDGGTLLAGTRRWTVSDPGRPRAAADLPLPDGLRRVDVLAYGPHGVWATSREHYDITVWYLADGLTPVKLGRTIHTAAPHSRFLASGRVLSASADQVLVLDGAWINPITADPAAVACRAVGRSFTRAEWAERVPDAAYADACA
ncbi:WD40 repeat domain-containing protein [Streptomyces sp. NPDC098789]|uniref:WD40 repeat domain-containing protein n=1 Tax=Streptomyces sp. NPDC098789 TaxID=3366098 RepID=UPI003804A4C0